MSRFLRGAAGAVLLAVSPHLHAADFHVSEKGNDHHAGTSADAPFRTLQRAAELV